MIFHALINGKTRTKQAYAEGQYTFPKGLHFGGFKLEKGPYAFVEYLRKLCDPTPVATIEIAINHHANLLPPKK